MYYRHYLDRIFIIHRLYIKVLHHRFTRTVTDLVYMSSIVTTPTAQTYVQCNENSIRSCENLSVSKLVKTAINVKY